MKRVILFLTMTTLLMGSMCDDQTIVYKTRYVEPEVPKELRTPCEQTARPYKPGDDPIVYASLVLNDTKGRADCNGIKIKETDAILTAYSDHILRLKDKQDAE